MGTNKAFIPVQGQRIIDRTAHLFNALFGQVILVTNTPLDYAGLDLEIAGDLMQKPSPLMGIYSGLFYSCFPYSFVAGCDMPFISRPVVEYMISLSPHHDIIIPLLDDGHHPLHAIYARRLLQPMEELLHAGKLKITDLFSRARVREVNSREFRRFDASLSSCFNINTPQDLERLPCLPQP